ncbi:hypothetical protein [Neobacillus jeddahensis]|uniref:hypothetical protein n=1 Tax=Neobacillus jeddahensis TaxID=1461580 RepID=UPI00058B2A20|nr:hypothetical protein [Neobacillus jeddahensis]
MKKIDPGFAIAGSIMSIIFLMLVNYLTSAHYVWFFYPAFVLLLWPVGVYSAKNGKHKQLALSYSVLLIAFLTVENFLHSSQYPWSMFAIYPIFCWPILAYLEKRALTVTVALIGSSSIILYYVILNLFLSPQYPWAIYPSFVVLWWPLAIYHAKRKTYFAFSVNATVLIAIFFTTVNAVSSPDVVWAVYPIFCVLWWPLSMYYFVYKRRLIK